MSTFEADDELNRGQAAEVVGVSHTTMIRWEKKNIGPKFKRIGGKLVYRFGDIQDWLESQTVDPEAQAS
jgi:predicted DNA-binding transcriptional regulator AlpA